MPTLTEWTQGRTAAGGFLPVHKVLAYRQAVRSKGEPLPESDDELLEKLKRDAFHATPVPDSPSADKATPPMRGLGDLVDAVTTATGIKGAVKAVAAAVGVSDCGCAQRQQRLNELMPFR